MSDTYTAAPSGNHEAIAGVAWPSAADFLPIS